MARFGGDEFVVLQVGIEQPSGARFLADRLVAMLSEPYDIGGTALHCGASIGVAISPPDAEDFETLIACADAALYKSKAGGRNSVSFFEPGMDAKIANVVRSKQIFGGPWQRAHFNWRISLSTVFTTIGSWGSRPFYAGLKAGARNLPQYSYPSWKTLA